MFLMMAGLAVVNKTALPFDLVCCTLDFPEFRHWLLPVIVFTAPLKTLRLA
jgi:hypothetical protein